MVGHVAMPVGGEQPARKPIGERGDGRLPCVAEMPAASGAFFGGEAGSAKAAAIHISSAQILPKIYQQIEEWALTAHQANGCRGVSHSDFQDDETGRFVGADIDTQPGTTETSLVPELAAHAGLNCGELVKWMVQDANLDR